MGNAARASRAIEENGFSLDEKALLSRSFLFDGLPEKRLSEVLENCRCMRLPARKAVYRRGEAGDEMCIVLSGGVKVSTLSTDGKEVIFDLLSVGDFFGELSLLDGRPRTATVTTLVPSVLVVMGRDFFVPFLEKNPKSAVRLLYLLARRLRAVDEFLEEVLFFDSETRLAKRITALKNIYGKKVGDAFQIEFKVSQQDIASMVGITRERVNKHLKSWERKGIVHLQQGHLVIQNATLLQEMANEAGDVNILERVN
jgi:CRP/FNR family cyclic AMP-dependent transcriptional regulator